MWDDVVGTLILCAMLVLAIAVSYHVCTAHAEPSVIGRIRIPARDIRAEITADDAPACDCCPALWNGGIVTTTADMSAVRLYDTADIITLDGGYYVLECCSISHAVKGFIKADGDVVICVKTDIPLLMRVYRFTRL